MVELGRALVELGLFWVMAAGLLVPVYLFARYRQQRALTRDDGRYVAGRDPWLPAVVAVSGAGVLALLRLVI